MTAVLLDEAIGQRDAPALLPRASQAGGGDRRTCLDGGPAGLVVGPDGTAHVSVTSGRIWEVPIRDEGPAAPPALVADRDGTGPRGPAGMALAPDGTIVVADASANRVVALTPGGDVRVLAGSAAGYRDGAASEALFRFPSDVAVGPDGTCYVADTGNDRIRTITPDGTVATLAGSGYDHRDGSGAAARLRRPAALDVGPDGTCYVADTGNNAIRVVTPDGQVTTLAGSPPGGDGDGVGDAVGMRWPMGLALGRAGALWVADHGNGVVRRIEASGASAVVLRLSGRRWPVAVALAPGGAVVVAAAVLDDPRRAQTWLLTGAEGRSGAEQGRWAVPGRPAAHPGQGS